MIPFSPKAILISSLVATGLSVHGIRRKVCLIVTLYIYSYIDIAMDLDLSFMNIL